MRPVRIAALEADVRRGAGGTIYLRSPKPLCPYPERLTEKLEYWAREAPTRTFLAQRAADGQWRRIDYAQTLARVRAIAQALIDRGLSPERPIVILSGNGIDHALLALGAMYCGVPYAPIAPAYSLQSRDFAALRRVFALTRPGLVYTSEAAPFDRAIRDVVPADVEVVASVPDAGSRPVTPLGDLIETPVTGAVDAAHRRVAGDTLVKILFTSGSTGRPKGVINTQRMLCSNQEMIRSVLLFLRDAPPVLCDWSPWNHTAGGNHNFGLVLFNGGTLYIDEGKPTPALFGTTLRNLREIPCTAHFAVPRLYEMLMPHLQADAVLREVFFRDLRVIFYAAAGLGQRFWDLLRDVAIEACGEELLIMTGFGATETAPFMMSTGADGAFAGMIGLPAPGLELKLAPVDGKLEGRVRGPSVTPGYLGDPELTSAAFDEEGFYRLGDAMRFVDPAEPRTGLIFDGRLAEDFKLSTGTWVSVGPLRARVLAEARGLAQDVVVAGPDRDEVTMLVFPNVAMCRALADLGEAPVAHVLAHPRVRGAFARLLGELGAQMAGSSTRPERLVLLETPPSFDARELTDKGSINQKAVLEHRRDLVEALYATPLPSFVITSSED